MLGMMRNWIYDRDPVEALRFEAPRGAQEGAGGRRRTLHFAGLISKLLTSNTHRVTVEMRPDETLEETQKAEEAGRLAAIRDDMSPDLAAAEATPRAKEKQMSSDDPEALATIPTLGKADLTRETGVAGKYDPVGLQRHRAKTGGVSAPIMNTLKVSADGAIGDPDDLVYRLVLRGKATHENAGELYELMGDASWADFGPPRSAAEMLKESKARYESAFRTSGQSFASARISATLSLPALVSELTPGVSHYDRSTTSPRAAASTASARSRWLDSAVRRFLSLDFLWNKVRVIGGAYGGSCAFNPISGAFVFSSYRDPNLKATLDNYDAAAPGWTSWSSTTLSSPRPSSPPSAT
ncbi:metallopeptidase [Aureococcus anophagefferens]|nr:metallopeptidase [Aureococcus anophagefferens]